MLLAFQHIDGERSDPSLPLPSRVIDAYVRHHSLDPAFRGALWGFDRAVLSVRNGVLERANGEDDEIPDSAILANLPEGAQVETLPPASKENPW